ncbi:MAG: glycosyltransferase family 4 protein [Patescibacteria group bacterium]
MARSERIRLLIHSPYRKINGLPSGVNSMIEESIPHLERLGCDVKTVRPAPLRYPFEKKDDSDYHLGRGVPAIVDSTDFEVGFAFSKRSARDILEDARPHIVECHEPAIPFAAHTLISANPKIDENRRLVPFAAVQHAGMPDGGVERITEFVREILTRAKRVKFNKFFLPVGFTPGWVQTLRDGFSSWSAVTEDTRDFWYKYNPQDYSIIPNGFEVRDFTPDGEIFEEWKTDGKRTVLVVARHDKRKGLDDLLLAHKENVKADYNVKLKLTGRGDMTEALEELVRREDIPDVEFLGSLSKPDLTKAYRTADVVVAPSVGGEGFNRTIVEGRMSGVLVVCTNIAGQKRAIGDELKGLMAEPKNPGSLAEKIRNVLDLPEEYAKELREQSRRSATQDFGWETVSLKRVAHYDQILSRHGQVPEWEGATKTFLSRIPIAGDIFVSDRPKKYQRRS